MHPVQYLSSTSSARPFHILELAVSWKCSSFRCSLQGHELYFCTSMLLSSVTRLNNRYYLSSTLLFQRRNFSQSYFVFSLCCTARDYEMFFPVHTNNFMGSIYFVNMLLIPFRALKMPWGHL